MRPHKHRPLWTRAALLAFFLLPGPAACMGQEWPPAAPLQQSIDESPGDVPPSIAATSAGAGQWRCTFQFNPSGPVETVSLAGTFNGWNPRATPMERADDGWTVTLTLPGGAHQYKFVENGDRWLHDPANPDGVDDNHGGRNSVLRLGRLAHLTESPARRGDGSIDPIGLEHRNELPFFFQALGPTRALIRYRTLAHDLERVSITLLNGPTVEMRKIASDRLFETHEAEVPLEPAADVHVYTFILTDGPTRARDPLVYKRQIVSSDVFRTPEWARNAVWYQIMPDRFRNGDPANDPDPVQPWTLDWFTPAPWEGDDGETFYKWFVFKRLYGGDIAGIEEKLPYLKDLGVNALYLNPVFKASTHHKYNATSYLHIDDHFGTKGDYDQVAATEDLLDPSTWKWTESDRRFLAFVARAHEVGFRVIIDGVFNHVGIDHPAFQDVQKNGQSSPFADWFDVTSWEPFEYTGWAGFGELPVFKKNDTGLASESARQHIFNVTRRWMDPDGDGDPRDGIDGWRLDVPNEIAQPFWAEWRTRVKSINPDAYITGEIWDRADTWLDGRHFDAVMNYEFARAAVAWTCYRTEKITPTEIDRRLRELRLAYPRAATVVMQNLLDSHDTDRIASMAHNPDRAYDQENRTQDNGPQYDNDRPNAAEYARARLALLLQMTYVGAPMVYYGDEAGMWGADDPTNRKPMLWEDLQPYEKPDENFVMKDHLEFYRRAIALRNAHPALRSGNFRTLLADNDADVWVFLRWDEQQQLIVALNASKATEVTLTLPQGSPSEWRIVFGDGDTVAAQDGRLRLRLPAVNGVVLQAPTP